MSQSLPNGAATQRFLASRGGPPDAPESWSRDAREPDAEDFEPQYIGWEIARCAPGLEGDGPAGARRAGRRVHRFDA